MSKILILCNSCIGLYKFRKELLEKLLQEKYEIHVSTPYDDIEIMKKLKGMGVFLHETRINRRSMNPFKDFTLVIAYIRLFLKLKPNYVLTYTIKPTLYGGLIALIFKVPKIATITGLGSIFQKNIYLTKIIKQFYKIVFKKQTTVFFQNKENFNLFLDSKIVSESNCVLVNGSGVNLEKFTCRIRKKEIPLNIIFIGRIMQEKGIIEYLNVAKNIKLKYGDKVKFQVLGAYEEIEYKERIETLQHEKIIEYLGVSKDVRKELKQVHCIINPSWHEGMSNVLLEAGAMRTFLIASNISGCREIVIDSKTGFLFEKQNIEELEKKVEEFINLSKIDYQNYIENSYQYISDNFDRQKIVDKYLKKITL